MTCPHCHAPNPSDSEATARCVNCGHVQVPLTFGPPRRYQAVGDPDTIFPLTRAFVPIDPPERVA